jgi:hypothetical protein
MQLTRCLNHVSAGLQTSGTVHPSLPCWWPTNTQTHPKVPDIRRESDPAFHPARHARRSLGAHTTIHIDQGQEPQHSRSGRRPKNTSVPVGKPVEGSPSKRPCPQHIMKVHHCQAMRVQTKATHQTYHRSVKASNANHSPTCTKKHVHFSGMAALLLSCWHVDAVNWADAPISEQQTQPLKPRRKA